MARRRPDQVLQKLRQLARKGKRREAADLLERTVIDKPNHAKARDELSRYLTGKPFSFEETDYLELQRILSDFICNPQQISTMRKGKVKRLYRRAVYLERVLTHMITVGDAKILQQLRNAIARDSQRRRKTLNKLFIGVSILLGVLFCTGASLYLLWQRANSAAEALSAFEKNAFDISSARHLLDIHDTGLNRTMNRRVGEEAARIKVRIKLSEKHAREVDAILSRIERREQSVVGQGVRRRVFIERTLRELGKSGIALQMRWSELCSKEQKELNQQRLSLAEELMSPLPEWKGLAGNIDEDVPLIKARLKELQQRINIYEDAADALKLPENIITPTRQEHESLSVIQKEIAAFSHLLLLLPSAHDYTQYKKLLDDFKAEQYPPALELLDIRSLLPTVNSVRGLMQEHGQNLKPGLLQAARESLYDGKPTFSKHFPANKEQLHQLDELLTNSALQTRLYELTNVADNLTAYTEQLPELRYGRACFLRSALDPQRDVSERKAVEWQNPHSVISRPLDPRPLFNELGLGNKSGFSSTANLPQLLTKLLQFEHKDVPPLAKAYVFHYLLKVNNSGDNAILSGLRFAPKMRKTVDSFERLRKDCGIKIDGDCWLRRSAAHAAAERKFAQWFHKHRKTDFSGELKKNLGALLSVTPRFVGYINERGEAVLFEQIKSGRLIWHLSGSVMTTSVWGEELQNPERLSPVFIMNKE